MKRFASIIILPIGIMLFEFFLKLVTNIMDEVIIFLSECSTTIAVVLLVLFGFETVLFLIAVPIYASSIIIACSDSIRKSRRGIRYTTFGIIYFANGALLAALYLFGILQINKITGFYPILAYCIFGFILMKHGITCNIEYINLSPKQKLQYDAEILGKKICPVCMNYIDRNAQFCSKCGIHLA